MVHLTVKLLIILIGIGTIGICYENQNPKIQDFDNGDETGTGNETRTVLSKNTEEQRIGRVFSLFSIVSFKNAGCKASSNLNGTCFTSSECTNKGGAATGNCASGFGVCCVFSISSSSGGTVNQNCTYIQNPGYPSATSGTTSVSYTVNKCSADVCFIRLDFETFTIMGPSDTLELTGGDCSTDKLTITTTSGQPIPIICGENSGQHIYIDVGSSASDTVTLKIDTPSTFSAKKWQIKTSQIPCNSVASPPNGCLQYFYSPSGRITTFNFPGINNVLQHLASQQYDVCIRPEAGICCIQYQVCADQGLSAFSLSSGDKTITNSILDENCTPGTRSADYISIDGASSVCSSHSTALHSKFCGAYFNIDTATAAIGNIPICDCTSPFRVGIYTNQISDLAAAAPNDFSSSRGVCLDFNQIPCGTSA